MTLAVHKKNYTENGYSVIDSIFSSEDIGRITKVIDGCGQAGDNFRKADGLFAIRQFLKEIPEVYPLIFTPAFRALITGLFGNGYFIVKSIYFDKPPSSNWFVAQHQDLTISVNVRADIDGYGPWTKKHHQYAVQPPLHILENNFTARIHLDATDEYNGALHVIPGSHKGVHRPNTFEGHETICPVPAGSVMVMSPLLLHSSGRITNDKQRRVIHIEFSNRQLPKPLEWAEFINIK